MNPELLLNHYIAPVYINTANMVVPIANIAFDSLYNSVVDFAAFAWQTITIIVCTFDFIIKEAIIALNTNLSFTEKILLSLCLYNLIASFVNEIDKMNQNNTTQDKLEKVEKYVNCIYSSEELLTWQNTLVKEIKRFRDQHYNKINELEKVLSLYKEKLDEQTNIVNEHQTNEQKIFWKVSQVNKELRKIKKEIEQYE